MNQEQLRKKIQHSLQEGFTQQEIRQVLRGQGIKHSRINQAFNQINNQNNQQNPNQRIQNQNSQQRPQQNREGQNPQQASQSQNIQNQGQQSQQQQNQFGAGQDPANQAFGDDGSDSDLGNSSQDSSGFGQSESGFSNSSDKIPGLDLTDSFYKVKQRLLLRRYSVYDQNDNKVLKAKKKLLSIKTDIPFMKPEEDQPVFRVKSEKLLNISNNYILSNEQNGDELAILDRKRTLISQVWRIRDPDDNSIVAEISSDSQVVEMFRVLGSRVPLLGWFTALIPHTYQIENVKDQEIGQLEGQLSIRDTYELNLQDSGQLDRESMIAAIISIDALEGN